ncbi:hypothetical protein [Nitrosomonas eutropha]|uniref:hypothetical protein n=1 Tax=Nitrosomonas eutropha TaxID=916 RepID=UPI00030F3C4A|nr:hypothetical protein [Nitrosomonas eutropha]
MYPPLPQPGSDIFVLNIVELRSIMVKQENMTFVPGIELHPSANSEHLHTF